MPVEYGRHMEHSIFSSKDLCLIRELPEIIDMGVDSCKNRRTFKNRILC